MEQGKAQAEPGKAQAEDVSDMGKDASKEGEAGRQDKAEEQKGGALDSKVADTDQQVLISQSADSTLAKAGLEKDALQDMTMPAGGQLLTKQGPVQQLPKKKQLGSSAANAGSSASSARVSVEVGQPGKRDGQDGQDLASADGKTASTRGGVQEVRITAESHKKLTCHECEAFVLLRKCFSCWDSSDRPQACNLTPSPSRLMIAQWRMRQPVPADAGISPGACWAAAEGRWR